MKLLLFSVAYPGESGGVQAVVRRVAAAARAAGHDATVAWAVSSPKPGDLALRFPPVEDWRGQLRRWRAERRNLAELRRLRPDVVNVHFASAEAAFFLKHRPALGYKLVLSVHGSDVFRPNADDAACLDELLAKADAVTAVTPALVEAVRERGVEARLIENGVDADFWAAGGDRGPTPPNVLTVGRLAKVKGHDVLIDALAQVPRRVPGAMLTVVGDGPERAALERRAEMRGIEAEFVGSLPPEAIRERMRDARVFALPSRSEGLPLALLEAMAAGLPAVASAVGGVPAVLPPDAGTLVPPEDPDRLATALVEYLADEKAAKAAGARARAEAGKYSAAAADAAYLQILTADPSPPTPDPARGEARP